MRDWVNERRESMRVVCVSRIEYIFCSFWFPCLTAVSENKIEGRRFTGTVCFSTELVPPAERRKKNITFP